LLKLFLRQTYLFLSLFFPPFGGTEIQTRQWAIGCDFEGEL
jgi:hypothetical protein